MIFQPKLCPYILLFLLVESIYLLSFKCSLSFVPTTTFSRRSQWTVYEKRIPLIDMEENKVEEFREDYDTNTNTNEDKRYKTRSILLQHALLNQSKKYQKLQTRVILLQDTIRKLVQDRRRRISQQETALMENNTSVNVSYVNQLEMELKQKEELNLLLQQRCDQLLMQEDTFRERNKYYVEALKNVTEELEYELNLFIKMRMKHTKGIASGELSSNRNDYTVSSHKEETMDIEGLIQLLRNQVLKIPIEREEIFSTWSKERDQMALDLQREKIKMEQGFQDIKRQSHQQQSLSSVEIFSSQEYIIDDTVGKRDFRKDEPSVYEDSKVHMKGSTHRTIFQNIWKDVRSHLHRAMGFLSK
jgi:hypothetical protein